MECSVEILQALRNALGASVSKPRTKRASVAKPSVSKVEVLNIDALLKHRIGDVTGKYQVHYETELITLRNNGRIIIAINKKNGKFAINDLHRLLNPENVESAKSMIERHAIEFFKRMGIYSCVCLNDNYLIQDKSGEYRELQYRTFYELF